MTALCPVRELLGVAAEASGVSAARLARRFASCLPAAAAGGGRSTLNNDGWPVQLVLSASSGGLSTRLLVDPASDEPSPLRRLARARGVLARWSAGWPLPARADLHAAVADCLPGRRALESLAAGAMWVGRASAGPAALAYVTGRWGPPAERWPRAAAWLARWCGLGAARTCRRLAPRCELASLAVAGDGRALSAKVYFRLRAPVALRELGLSGLAEPRVARFLDAILAGSALRRSGLLLSFSSPFGTGRVDGAKIDLCAHCLAWGPAEWADRLEGLAAALAVPPPVDRATLVAGRAEVAFVGLGLGRRCRLNLYLKPAGDPARAAPAAAS